MAEAAIRGYKFFIEEDATLHVAWLNAKYSHGPRRTNQSWQPATM